MGAVEHRGRQGTSGLPVPSRLLVAAVDPSHRQNHDRRLEANDFAIFLAHADRAGKGASGMIECCDPEAAEKRETPAPPRDFDGFDQSEGEKPRCAPKHVIAR